MSLTSQELKDKISMVEQDIANLRKDAGNDRKISILIDYIDYLKDELKILERK
jgi:hypothetical protein